MILKSKISGLAILFVILSSEVSFSQQAWLKGVVIDTVSNPIEAVTISFEGTSFGTYTNNKGEYSISFPNPGKEISVIFSRVGFKSVQKIIKVDVPVFILNITLREEITDIGEITVSSDRENVSNPLMRIPVKEIRLLPSASGSFEAILKTMPGVSSNNELSSQYSVRGGNYDENLVYVNDVEIFRPFLIRSGQQEGLSFINPDMVSSIRFSSGGFSAIYGDKMSSVLDINYRKPVSNHGSINLGLLTSSAHYEGISKDKRFSYLVGIRYKSSRLMLKTLDSKGDYQPVFADIQSLISYKTGERSNLSLLSTFSSNTYNFIPQSRESTFGNNLMAYKLYVLFEGREKDIYRTWNSVLTWEFSSKNSFNHRFLASVYNSTEKESFDIKGWYSLNSLDKNFGDANISDSVMNVGIGNWLNHARNWLTADIYSFTYKGEKKWDLGSIGWGVNIRNDNINDRIREWTKVDSAGYSLPLSSGNLLVTSFISTQNSHNNWLYNTYLQTNKKFLISNYAVILNAGVRALYSTVTEEILVSPRISASMEVTGNLSVHLSGGTYFQPPLYREMRFPDGSLNKKIKSQRSIHTVLGMNYNFKAWGRPFNLTTEVYNKILSNIIPYRMDNVRIIYSGENSAKGYARGLDFHLTGEFVQDAESWISLSIMDSKLEIPSKNPGKFPSPSDQTFNMNIFFQDYLPGYPSWRAHINISFVTGIPVISPYNDNYNQYHRLPAYRRVDLGFTKILKAQKSITNKYGLLKNFNEVLVGIEIFNLLDINNTISYLWIKTVNNLSGETRQFAVPNYLTGRSLNLKLSASF